MPIGTVATDVSYMTLNQIIKSVLETWPQKAEHDILNDRKYKKFKKFSFFQAQISLECYFSAHKC